MLPWKPNSSPYLHPYRLAASLAPALSVAVFLSLLHLSASLICVQSHNMAKMRVSHPTRVFMWCSRWDDAELTMQNMYLAAQNNLSLHSEPSLWSGFLIPSQTFWVTPPPLPQSNFQASHIFLMVAFFLYYILLLLLCTIRLLIPLLNTYNISPRTHCS